MKTNIEALEGNKVKVVVTIEAAEIDARIKKTYKDFAQKYNFPGFRKGKAPRAVINNALGAEYVLATVTDDAINDVLPLTIDDCGLFPVGQADVNHDAGLVEEGKDYSFFYTVEVKPEYELSSYEPVEIELPTDGASDAEVDEQVEGLLERYAEFVDAPANTKVKKDSFVELKMTAKDDKGEEISSLGSENRLYGVGAGLLPEAFDAEIIGMKKGETKDFTIEVAEDEAATLTLALLGTTKTIDFSVEVVVVKKQKTPELTDEWVKETFSFETVDEMREQVADTIKMQKAQILPQLKENCCLAELGKRFEGEVSEALVEQSESALLQEFFTQLQRQGMTFDGYLKQNGLTSDSFKEDVKKQAADTAKQDLALDAWARHFEITVSNDELMDEFMKADPKNAKKMFKDWQDRGQLYLVREGVMRAKAITNVIETAVVTETDPTTKAKSAKKTAKKKAE